MKIIIGIVVLVAMLAPLISLASFRRKGNFGPGPARRNDDRRDNP